MAKPTLSAQLPASALADPQWMKVYGLMVRGVFGPFRLEQARDFDAAIKEHKFAVEMTEKMKGEKRIPKFNRKMYERQLEVHRERLAYLEQCAARGSFDEVVPLPTRFSSETALAAAGNVERSISLDHKELVEYEKREDKSLPVPERLRLLVAGQGPTLAQSLQPSAPALEFKLTHDSELIDLGIRSHWFFVKDSTARHTLYAMQGLWDMEMPMIVALLRRCNEFIPGGGTVHVNLVKQSKHCFKMRMQHSDVGETWETPDNPEKSKAWSPRRFQYGGRHFVWEGVKGGLFNKFAWETLYETSPQGEKIGDKLFWGVNHGGMKTSHTLSMAAGLDQCFREHLLASQLARLLRCSYPPNKDVSGVEKAGMAVGALGMAMSLASLMG